LAVLGLTVAGCGSSSTSSSAAVSGSDAQIGSAAISRAADVSGAAKGEKVAYSLTESLPSIGRLSVTGSGTFNASPQQGQMSLDVSIPGISSLGSEAAALSNVPLTLVVDDQTIYVKLPSALASKVNTYTGGKPWVSVSLAKLASGSKIPGLSSVLNGSTSPTNPAAALKELEAASSSGITKVGAATVNGIATTEYSATLDLSKLSSALPAAQRKLLKQSLAAAAKQTGLTQIPFDVYIDSADLIRRLTMNFSFTVHGTSVPVALTMNFLAYGPQPAPTVPAAGSVFDLTGLLSSIGSGMGASGTLGG
jgi:hypothetical protein